MLFKKPQSDPAKKPMSVADTNPQAPGEIQAGATTFIDIVAPAAFVNTANYVQLNNYFIKTFFVYTYPRYLNTNWLSPLINLDATMDISMHIYPVSTPDLMRQLKRRQTNLESSLSINREKGMVRDPELETAISDIDALRDTLQKGESKIFHYSLYFTLYSRTKDELETLSNQLESTLGGLLIYTKQTYLQMEQGFNASLPLHLDELQILRNLDTASLSTTFPFNSATLTSSHGILYGLNRHNNSLILFDRFDLENANSTIFASSGSGKSFLAKLEVIRYLMLGTDVIVVDPENEYKNLAEALGGSFISISLNSDKRINPFDLPTITAGETAETVLRSNVSMLTGLIGLMTGGLTPDESNILDKALFEVYSLKDITTDPNSFKNPAPTLTDLEQVLQNITGAENLIKRLQKYLTGSYAGLFTKPTNFNLENGLVVFSIRDLEEGLRPIAMYTILSYIWAKIRKTLRRRLLVIDEAWVMMQHEDSAKFVHMLAKRARKYYLGLTIISQDVEDFLNSPQGRSVLNNSAMQILLKQSTAAIEKIKEVFNLTESEKFLLLESDVGEGLFFAGKNHVAVKIIASYTEEQIITTDPRQLLEAQQGQNSAQG
ncbi:MAG: Type IV secretory pathway VirB4 components-like protein [Candidatus Berkelbacteria bacterium Licking1014_7]|uniref:Type IV secretory pathway VirB4 components-like protein n=1 Tax=Candidatus Berkelbacteria bacterium Licking1014_7 TaxID=2017147 RepID=A0A554LLJ3_9BACT|nr:MAG: Type IV secretory pathway VirB4 components-like protein [Candidatus Berkelbacteria bacterium Licking1014_7]